MLCWMCLTHVCCVVQATLTSAEDKIRDLLALLADEKAHRVLYGLKSKVKDICLSTKANECPAPTDQECFLSIGAGWQGVCSIMEQIAAFLNLCIFGGML